MAWSELESNAPRSTLPVAVASLHPMWRYLGLLYLMTSLMCSSLFLYQLKPSVDNDYWWPGFNTTGLQTFLADVYNLNLAFGRQGDLPLSNGVIYMTKKYSLGRPKIEWGATYVRQLLLGNIPFPAIISGMRRVGLEQNYAMTAPYCWLDLNRTFSLAHTYKRQRRCNEKYQLNAALYLETLLRNVQSGAFLGTSQSPALNATILTPLRRTSQGIQWIKAMAQHIVIPIEEEAQYWYNHGLRTWSTNYQNLFHDGIDETILIENALGYQQSIRVKKFVSIGRGLGLWTTYLGSAGFWNDLSICQFIGCSLLLNFTDSVPDLGYQWDIDLVGVPRTIGGDMMQRVLGPFLSIDLRWVHKPRELVQFGILFNQKVFDEVLQIASTSSVSLDPAPNAWRQPNLLYLGGSPLCPFGQPLPYIQQSFGYYDGCTTQEPLTVQVTPLSAMFAHNFARYGDSQIPSICAQCSTSGGTCEQFLYEIFDISAPFFEIENVEAVKSVLNLNVKMMQMATVNMTSTMLLSQSLVTDPSGVEDLWSFFGWVMVYDWLIGGREVVNFEGDEGSMTLMSQLYEQHEMVANPLEIPRNACNYIWYCSSYVTLILAAVGIYTTLFLHKSVQLTKLVQFNRIVGSVWIGRPLMFLRGMTALVLMSTSHLSMNISEFSTVTWLEWNHRNLFWSALLAGEATWPSYVMQDIFLPLSIRHRRLTMFVCGVLWLILVLWDQIRPQKASATIQPFCQILHLALKIECVSGVVYIGSINRFVWMSGVVICTPFIVYLAGLFVFQPRLMTPLRSQRLGALHELMPGAAHAYLIDENVESDWKIPSSLLMAGVVSVYGKVFDVKLWRYYPASFPGVSLLPSDHSGKKQNQNVISHPKRSSRLMGLIGLAYMAVTVIGSYSYLIVTESTMANDFWWEDFNSTGLQAYLSNWLNTQLITANDLPRDLQVDAIAYGDTLFDYGGSSTNVLTYQLYASHIQDEINTLTAVVQSLRTMDSCLIPWVATRYCFVDFGRKWELAPSINLQERCKRSHEVTNGAVYMDSFLRNAVWATLMQCWGASLQIGVFSYLETSLDGRAWLKSTQDRDKSVEDEVGVWRSLGIQHYTTQWQSYKRMGFVESFTIQNSFGSAYSLTLKRQEGEFQMKSTSFRMHLPLSCILWALAPNNTHISTLSLIRSSPNFAFSNFTMENLLITNGTLTLPLDRGLALTRGQLGPFGTIDMYRISVPDSLKDVYRMLSEALQVVIATNKSAYEALVSIPPLEMFSVSPERWNDVWRVGGNIMCSLGAPVNPRLSVSYTADGSCSDAGADQQWTPTFESIMAMIAVRGWSLNTTHIARVCAQETSSPSLCRRLMTGISKFLRDSFDENTLESLYTRACTSAIDFQSKHNPQLLQFIQNSTSYRVDLALMNLFGDPVFDLFGWFSVFKYQRGLRSIVQFVGDTSNITLVSSEELGTSYAVNPQEIPINVAFYLRCAMQYLTVVLLCVASVACAHIVFSRGLVEGFNMLAFNRVAGLVWVGRVLMTLRGITAICILATSSVGLLRPYPNRWYFRLSYNNPPWYKTVFSSGEMGWFVYVVQDVFSIVTAENTFGYAWKSSNLVWLIAAIWTSISPVECLCQVHRQCTLVTLDYETACSSARLEIGSLDRFLGLMGLALSCCFVCYVIEYCTVSNSKKDPPHSLQLHAAAHSAFRRARWIRGEYYFMDRASAVLNGILSCRIRGRNFAVDVKTWSVVTVGECNIHYEKHLQLAIPLHCHQT